MLVHWAHLKNHWTRDATTIKTRRTQSSQQKNNEQLLVEGVVGVVSLLSPPFVSRFSLRFYLLVPRNVRPRGGTHREKQDYARNTGDRREQNGRSVKEPRTQRRKTQYRAGNVKPIADRVDVQNRPTKLANHLARMESLPMCSSDC